MSPWMSSVLVFQSWTFCPFCWSTYPINNPRNCEIKAIFIDDNAFRKLCVHKPKSNLNITVIGKLIPKDLVTNILIGRKCKI